MSEKRVKRIINLFNAAEFLGVLIFAVIMLIPAVSLTGTTIRRMGAYALATAFWLSVISLIIISIYIANIRRDYERYENKQRTTEKRIWVAAFFRNRKAALADLAMIASAVIVAVLAVTHSMNRWLIISSSAVLAASIVFHCLLNGQNYVFIKELKEKGEYR